MYIVWQLCSVGPGPAPPMRSDLFTCSLLKCNCLYSETSLKDHPLFRPPLYKGHSWTCPNMIATMYFHLCKETTSATIGMDHRWSL